jgi:hypothetical protein
VEVVARLLAASRERRVLDLGGATVAAEEIRAACLAAAGADPYGLRLSHARVDGALDLRAFELAVPLRLASCEFTGPIDVTPSSATRATGPSTCTWLPSAATSG